MGCILDVLSWLPEARGLVQYLPIPVIIFGLVLVLGMILKKFHHFARLMPMAFVFAGMVIVQSIALPLAMVHNAFYLGIDATSPLVLAVMMCVVLIATQILKSWGSRHLLLGAGLALYGVVVTALVIERLVSPGAIPNRSVNWFYYISLFLIAVGFLVSAFGRPPQPDEDDQATSKVIGS